MADNTSQIAGLFMTPELYQQQQQLLREKQAMEMAKLSPFEQGIANTYMGVGNLVNTAGQALGAQDPMLRLLSTRNKLAGQFDTSSAEGLIGLSQALRQSGDLQGAAQVAQQALAAREKEATIQSKLAEKLSTEQKNAAALADSAGFGRGTPEWAQKYNEELTRLTTGNKGANIKEIGVAEGSREPVYFDAGTDTQFIMKQDPMTGKQVRVPFNGGVDRTTARTNLNVKLPEGEAEFMKRLGTKDADRVDAAMTARDNSISALNSLNKLASLPDAELISGQFASGRVGATNLLETLGLASKSDAARLATSQQYQKVAGDVILQTLGGKLGAGFSNDDRKFIQGLIPQLETNPIARRKLIEYMQNKNKEIVSESIRLENYARENRGLKGYEPRMPIPTQPSGTSSAASRMTDEQLKDIAGIKQ